MDFKSFTPILGVACILLLISTSFGDECSIKYRTYDGTCNNLKNPQWGSSGSKYLRLIPQRDGNLIKTEDILQEIQNSAKNEKGSIYSNLVAIWSELLKLDLDQESRISHNNNEFVNGATSYLDLSFFYASNSTYPYLMLPYGHIARIHSQTSDFPLDVILNLLTSEHNRLVGILRKKKWNENDIFEEARRILIAQVQHITINEYAKLFQSDFPLGQYTGYDDTKEPGIFKSFVHGVLRILPHFINLEDNTTTTWSEILQNHIRDLRSFDLKTMEKLITAERKDKLPSYEDMINFCTISSTSSSSQLKHYYYYLLTLKTTFNDTNTDLLYGILMEILHNDKKEFPEIMSCLLHHQLLLIRQSDRFWFENITPYSLNTEQISEISKTTLSGLICANFELNSIQVVSFLTPGNSLNTQCSSIKKLRLESWIEYNEKDEIDNEKELVEYAIRKAEDDVTRRQQTEFLLWSKSAGGIDPKSPAGTAASFSKANKNALLLANNSILLEYASNELIKRSFYKLKRRRRRQLFDGDDSIISLTDDSDIDFLQDLDINKYIPNIFNNVESTCPAEVEACDINYPYRSHTGYCNNLRRPNYGKSLTTFSRLLPPAYEDGISKPRQTSIMGIPLPSARLVSSMIHVDVSNLHRKYSLMLMQFAQFIDHDITFTPVHRGFFSSIPDCRPCDSPITVHPECMPIEVPAGDPFYPQVNLTSGKRFCLPFMRSLPGQQRLGSRDPINQNSAYLDGSQIYGEHACLAKELRSTLGKLNVTYSPYNDKDLLPQSSSHPECKSPLGYCFIAGDGRASEQPGLTTIHTIFMREHNRVADGLRIVNPHWDDETLYQHSRRILIAEYQHIVFNEFLPRILGWSAINIYGLSLEPFKYYKGYAEECNPSILTEFASAAFRIGHSLLRPHIPRASPTYSPLYPNILLRENFFNPDIIYQRHMIDEIVRGIVSTPMENLDQFVTREITNHLFEDKKIPHSGMDLPALNIQRARDHGIPSYNEFRAMCNLKRAETWEHFSRELPNDVIARLRRVYPTVDDVDLFPAGISERPVQGGIVGPTFACIIGLQFRKIRACDRFWYETEDGNIKFSPKQLKEIRKATLSKLLCDNLDILSPIQMAALDLPDDLQNPRLDCTSLPSVNLEEWREPRKGCQVAGRSLAIGETDLPSPCTSCICTPEGNKCASIRVTDCTKLIEEVGTEAVLKDQVCLSQCADYVVTNLQNDLNKGRALNYFPVTGLTPPVPPRRYHFPRNFSPKDLAAAILG